MEIHETPLPGLGIRYDFKTSAGNQVAIINRNTGRRDLIVYDDDDPDTGREILTVAADEADTLAELFGAARITGPLADLQQNIDGLSIDWLAVTPGSPYDGRPLGDTQARTRTGASIVAVVRAEEAIASPRPDFVFQGGDTIVVVGTTDGVKALSQILAG